MPDPDISIHFLFKHIINNAVLCILAGFGNGIIVETKNRSKHRLPLKR
jgi:ABC-type microcin C transport system permease subunit YejB